MSSWYIEDSKSVRNRDRQKACRLTESIQEMQDQARKEGTPPGEPCPIFPGRPQKLHWSIPDPAKATGTDTEINAAFDQAFFLLKERIEALRT